jgi:phosphopantothenoylcysteine decarboxylase/phosphopantothenate--cysteine ligase
MNDRMFSHPQVQANVAHLRDGLRYLIEGPATGPLAVGEGEGPGRFLDPAHVCEAIGRALGRDEVFAGRAVLVTAGPTHEPVDPVRYVGNRSSGRMGYAIARAAWRRGAEVTLVSGPSSLPEPYGVRTVRVETAQEMHDAVAAVLGDADLSVFAAAVADFRPGSPHDRKVKRAHAGDALTIDLVANPDVALDTRALRKAGSVAVGFALETDDLRENARKKLEAKGFDLIVANDAGEEGAGFGVETNRVTLLSRDGRCDALPLMSKDEVADILLDRVADCLAAPSEKAMSDPEEGA